MDDIVIKLPLRLIPRKVGAVFLFGFFLFFFGFPVVWTTMATTAALTGEMAVAAAAKRSSVIKRRSRT